MQILIVDDEKNNAEQLKDYIELVNPKVKVNTVDGTVLATYELKQKPYNLVLTDIKMKEAAFGGLEFLDQVAPSYQDVKFIVYSAIYGSEVAERFLEKHSNLISFHTKGQLNAECFTQIFALIDTAKTFSIQSEEDNIDYSVLPIETANLLKELGQEAYRLFNQQHYELGRIIALGREAIAKVKQNKMQQLRQSKAEKKMGIEEFKSLENEILSIDRVFRDWQAKYLKCTENQLYRYLYVYQFFSVEGREKLINKFDRTAIYKLEGSKAKDEDDQLLFVELAQQGKHISVQEVENYLELKKRFKKEAVLEKISRLALYFLISSPITTEADISYWLNQAKERIVEDKEVKNYLKSQAENQKIKEELATQQAQENRKKATQKLERLKQSIRAVNRITPQISHWNDLGFIKIYTGKIDQDFYNTVTQKEIALLMCFSQLPEIDSVLWEKSIALVWEFCREEIDFSPWQNHLSEQLLYFVPDVDTNIILDFRGVKPQILAILKKTVGYWRQLIEIFRDNNKPLSARELAFLELLLHNHIYLICDPKVNIV